MLDSRYTQTGTYVLRPASCVLGPAFVGEWPLHKYTENISCNTLGYCRYYSGIYVVECVNTGCLYRNKYSSGYGYGWIGHPREF